MCNNGSIVKTTECLQRQSDIAKIKFIIERKLDSYTWRPRLDQLLSEGDKRKYKININASNKTQWFSDVECWDEERQELYFVYETDDLDTPEDAAGQALLWILEQGA